MDGEVHAVIDNELLRSPWRRGHKLVLRLENLLEMADVSDRLTFQSLVAALGSQPAAAFAWQDLKVIEGAVVQPKPGTRFVVPSPVSID